MVKVVQTVNRGQDGTELARGELLFHLVSDEKNIGTTIGILKPIHIKNYT